jgi:hypothetical protein
VKISEDTDDTRVYPSEIPEMRPRIAAQNVTALICTHKTYAEVEWDTDRDRLRGIDFTDGRPDLTDVGPEGAPS